MIAATCPICGRPTGGAVLCRACHRTTTSQLAELPWLLGQLSMTATRQDLVGSGGPKVDTSRVNSSLPFNPHATDLLRDILHMLDRWAHNIAPDSQKQAQDARRQPDARLSTQALCEALSVAHSASRTAAWAAQLHRDIDTATRRILTAVNPPTAKAAILAGPCPETDTQGEHCTGEVFAWFPADTSRRPIMQCNTCETQWPAEQWARLGQRIRAEQARQDRAEQLARQIAGRQ